MRRNWMWNLFRNPSYSSQSGNCVMRHDRYEYHRFEGHPPTRTAPKRLKYTVGDLLEDILPAIAIGGLLAGAIALMFR